MAKIITVWRDDESDPNGEYAWIVGLDEGDNHDTLHVVEDRDDGTERYDDAVTLAVTEGRKRGLVVYDMHNDVLYNPADEARQRLDQLYAAADEGGVIQAIDMVRLFPGEPKKHTTASIYRAAMWSNISEEDYDNWCND